jgi:hypothetical protein
MSAIVNTAFDKKVTEGLVWSDKATVDAAIARIATGHSDKLIVVKMGSLAYDKGANGGSNGVPDVTTEWDAFAALHYATGSGRKMPGDKTRINYISGYGGIAMLGAHKAYDTMPVFEYAMAPAQRRLLKGADKVGAFCRKVVECHPDVAPTAEQLKALLPTAKVDTARSVADELNDMIVEAFGNDGTFGKMFAGRPIADLLRLDMLAMWDAFQRKIPADAASEDGVNYKAEAEKLRKQIKAEQDAAKAKA